MWAMLAPASHAAMASLAICSGVTGTAGLSRGVSSAPPVSAQLIIVLFIMVFGQRERGARRQDRAVRHVSSIRYPVQAARAGPNGAAPTGATLISFLLTNSSNPS